MNKSNINKGEIYTQKGSKFLGFLAEVNSIAEFNLVMADIKKEHKKASHYCFAYIINEPKFGEQTVMFNDALNYERREKYSNDNEPSGCGVVLLNLLKQNKLENHVIIVVRYFGGVLLGQGNLIRAYGGAGKLALNGRA